MNMQSVEGSSSWAQFMKLTGAARIRNAGFDMPLAPQRNADAAKNKNAFRDAISGVPRAGKLYTRHIPKQRKPVLGNRFDAYA